MYRVIFEHHPKAGQEKEFIETWQKGSDIIQQYPGAQGTLLFRSSDNPDVLYAMAEWSDKHARDMAMHEIERRPDAEEILTAHEQFLESHTVIVSADMIAVSKPVL